MKNNVEALRSMASTALNQEGWMPFRLLDFFTLCSGKERQGRYKAGTIPLVATGTRNNGVCEYVTIPNRVPFEENSLSISNIDSKAVFYQKHKHFVTQNVFVLHANFDQFDENLGLALCPLISSSLSNYGWGNYIGKAGLSKLEILMPSCLSSEGVKVPDWTALKERIKAEKLRIQIEDLALVSSRVSALSTHPADTSGWLDFELQALFIIKGSETTPKARLLSSGKGNYPYITTKASDNGVEGYYGIFTEQGNCLTIDSAVLGTCFYQANDFSASDHVELLMPKFAKFNGYHGLFLQTVINRKNEGVYSYANKCNQKRIRATNIRLPALPDGTPDWETMETYIKHLLGSLSLESLLDGRTNKQDLL